MKKQLKLTIEQNVAGYLMEDIERFLPPEEFKEFSRWFDGQTAMLTKDGKVLVYRWDWERYRAGLPAID